MKTRALVVLLALTSGCGSEGDEEWKRGSVDVPRPALQMVAPTSIRAGEDLSVFGSGFIDQANGRTELLFEGTYQTSGGQTETVHLSAVAKPQSQGLVLWNFGPNIPFTMAEDTGVFRGKIWVKNVGRDGQERQGAEPLSQEIQVLPSILIQQMGPADASCPVGITATTAESKFIFELKAVGLKAGTGGAPLRFVYTFMKEHFKFEGYVSDQPSTDPEQIFPAVGPVSILDEVRDGNISRLGGAQKDVSVFKGGVESALASLVPQAENQFGLSSLTTAPVATAEGDGAADSFVANMIVVAEDSAGQEAKRTFALEVFAPVEIANSASSAAVESFDPVPVSGCIPGGPMGRDVTYNEMSSETRMRSYKVGLHNTSGLEGGTGSLIPINIGARVSSDLGFDVDAQVSSAQSKDLAIHGQVLPGEFGAFYRQTIKMERSIALKGHTPCGEAADLGEVIVTDWVWSPDLAIGQACPPLPVSNLSPGAKLTK